VYAFIGLFNSFIANDKPLVAFSKAGIECPVWKDFIQDLGFGQNYIYKPKVYEWAIHPPVPFHAKTILPNQANLDPIAGYRYGHYLGTDHLGRDVLAGIFRGCYNSLRIGLLAILLSLLIGVTVGGAMAYFKNDKIKLNIPQLILTLFSFLLGGFYIFYLPTLFGKLITIILFAGLIYLIINNFHKNQKLSLPVDAFFNILITLRKSIPTLIFILACLPLFKKPSSTNVLILLSLLGWTNIARHTRIEALSILNKEYVQSAQLMGAGFWYILRNHIWPQIKPTIGVVASLAFGSYLVIEASLSFLGIGLSPDEVGWGSMISIVRNDLHLWWLVLFPGMALFIIIYAFTALFDKSIEVEN
jgi:peptide/nickel transport system permease protein